jgi:hypothetical protein
VDTLTHFAWIEIDEPTDGKASTAEAPRPLFSDRSSTPDGHGPATLLQFLDEVVLLEV